VQVASLVDLAGMKMPVNLRADINVSRLAKRSFQMSAPHEAESKNGDPHQTAILSVGEPPWPAARLV
jgi:hypothetical protein